MDMQMNQPQAPPAVSTQDFMETAFGIGIELCRDAIWDGDRCNWIGSAVEVVGNAYGVAERSYGIDMYNGTSGVALFLAYLYEATKDPVILNTLDGTIATILSADDADLPSNYGYYGGQLGAAASLIKCGELAQKPEWAKAGWDKMQRCADSQIQDFEVDVISGMAGAIPVFLKHYAASGNQSLLQAAIKCGNKLLDMAHKSDTGWTWVALAGQPALTGYSHGAAGIALGLLELYHVTQEPNYYTAAMMGFAWERTTYNPQVQNWPDLRDQNMGAPQPPGQPQTPVYGDAWCHGAPGIAMSRIRAWELTNDNTLKSEGEIALSTTHRGIYGHISNQQSVYNYSLCHGIAGNADIILEGGRKWNHPEYVQMANEVGRIGIERIAKNKFNWPSGVNDPSGATQGMSKAPGMMLGMAGTGYFYLRLANPDKYPSMLLL